MWPEMKKFKRHHDVQERGHLQEPEPHHAHARLEEEADQEREHSETAKATRVSASGKPSKYRRQTKNRRSKE